MFDTEKIIRMTTLLEKIPEQFDDVYIIPDLVQPEATALFKRLKLPVRAIVHDFATETEIAGWKIIKTAEAAKNFNERTVLIVLTKKPVPFIQTTFDFRNRGGVITAPALVMAPDEILAVYDRVMIETLKKLYDNDGISAPKANPEDLIQRFARGVTTMIHPHFQNFKYQFWDRQRYFKPTYTFNDTAIVIQGPLVYENNYTAETFKLYRSIYPNVPIIISTWQGEANQNFRRECQENFIVLLENEPPKVRGPWNINMQLKSSFEGVKLVKENFRVKFVLKTRTDQRINKPDFLTYFKNLIRTFPPFEDKLRGRILLLEGSKGLPFRTSDFLSFGYVEDIFRLYNIPQHNGRNDELTYRKNHPQRQGFLVRVALSCKNQNHIPEDHDKKFRKFNKIASRIAEAESYILRNFYNKYIGTIDKSKILKTSWKFMRDYLLIISIKDIDLDWFKYENPETYDIRGGAHFNEINFSRWLDLYQNFKCDWI